jgi:hypothetical protein
MGLLDDVKKLETAVAARLRELTPLVEEHAALKQLADKLGIDPSAPPAKVARSRARKPGGSRGARNTASLRRQAAQVQRTSPTAESTGAMRSSAKSKPAAAKSSAKPATAGRRAARGTRQQQLLDLVRKQPGITVSEAGKKMKVDPTSLYRAVGKLTAEGALEKRDTKLHPAGK